MKQLLFFLLFFWGCLKPVFGQVTETSIRAKIDKTLTFYESKKDSIKLMAEQIRADAQSIGLKKEALYYHRFMGFYYEYDGKIDLAVKSYLTLLKEAEKNQFFDEKYQAIGDLVNIYISTEQNEKAKVLLFKGILEGQKEKANPRRLSTYYTNLGVIYRKESKFDSAFYYYTQALKIKKNIKDSVGIANVYINLATLLIKQGKYAQAKPYIERNIAFHKAIHSDEDLWYDYGNMSEIYLKLNQRKEAEWYVNECLRIAKKSGSKTKEHISMNSLADLHRYFGDYKKAYEYYAIYDSLGKELINAETNKSIAQLREQYESEKKEQENKLLNQQLKQEQQQRLIFGISFLGVLLFSGVIGYFLVKNRQKNKMLNEKNELIERQNTRLSDLNREKNQLISIVSHDLSTPFLVINTWNSILKMNIDAANTKALEAVQIIEKSAKQGMNLIQDVLNVEKAETNKHTLRLETFDLQTLTQEVLNEFAEAARAKNIQLLFEPAPQPLHLLSDPHLVQRVLENLVSNAIKYSNPNGRVWVSAEKKDDTVLVHVKDEGIGIESKHLPHLFEKYNTASAATAGNLSTGLGLSIVKRILDEIGGIILCKSEPGKGTEFTVRLAV
ncbi:tetratricopeptide repeat-containing sensor histidine kinase [Runella salmonicolor]|uniref:histidine kinase n=1 Tax=Runella salmonicolor TaxID=2950278 RepID=A0ABT1FUR0_9BACT|nr:ATP-binding protein [Runella salmonicolor]MCP1385220.1 tetratricopeptide repeat-containing sensor histidine kinase [Runella salmonicolor]